MIHQYKMGGYFIVLDIFSGSIHVVDEIAYDIIALFEEKTKEEIVALLLEKHGRDKGVSEKDILSCYEEVVSLKESGRLFAVFRQFPNFPVIIFGKIAPKKWDYPKGIR